MGRYVTCDHSRQKTTPHPAPKVSAMELYTAGPIQFVYALPASYAAHRTNERMHSPSYHTTFLILLLCLAQSSYSEPSETHFQFNYKKLQLDLPFPNTTRTELDLTYVGLAYGERYGKKWYTELQAGYSLSKLSDESAQRTDGKGKFGILSASYALWSTPATSLALGASYLHHQIDEDQKLYKYKTSETAANLQLSQKLFKPLAVLAAVHYINGNDRQDFPANQTVNKLQRDGEIRYEFGLHIVTQIDGEMIVKYFTENHAGFEIVLKKVYK